MMVAIGKKPAGLTFNLQPFSTEDEPGIHTTVFVKRQLE
jgi:hypothetical protein